MDKLDLYLGMIWFAIGINDLVDGDVFWGVLFTLIGSYDLATYFHWIQ